MHLSARFFVTFIMYRRFLVVFFLFMACKSAVFAQSPDEIIQIEGEIRESGSGDPVPYVHILNHESGIGTVSNREGRFWIRMYPEDTLLFSAIGFETYAFTLNPEQNSRRLRVEIELNTSTQVLEPVNVFAYRDEESLKQAIIDMDVQEIEVEPQVIIPGAVDGPPASLNPSITISGPISFFYNKFSRRAKLERKLVDDQLEYNRKLRIQAKYNPQIIRELTGLPEDKVEEFMAFCTIEEAFIDNATEYDIALVVTRCLTEFRKVSDQ